MEEKVITLPGRDEMQKRLLAINGSSHLQQKFYPILLEYAGRQLFPQGVVTMLVLAIHDYIEGMPPMMSDLMYMSAPKFIEALVDNPEDAERAKTFLQDALSAK